MLKIVCFTFLAAAVVTPIAAGADTSPLVNNIIVQQALQQQMQNQLNTQARELQGQQNLSSSQMQLHLLHENMQMQYLQLQQQQNLLRLRQQLNSVQVPGQPRKHP